MKTRNSKAKAFAFLGAAFVLLIALIFTGCPNNAGGGGSGGGNIDGVWKMDSSKMNDEASVPFPVTMADNSTEQPYFCFSEGKVYSANEIAGKADNAENGLFKDGLWDLNYTFANGILTIAEGSVAFIITGDTATMTMTNGGNTMVIQLTRVSAPTVAEIKAAKAKEP